MSNLKCPHCGLVNFAAEATCKRCKKDLTAAADSGGSYRPTNPINKSGSRFQSDNPLAAWAITFVLLISNATLAYTIAQKGATNSSAVLGETIGGIVAWPI